MIEINITASVAVDEEIDTALLAKGITDLIQLHSGSDHVRVSVDEIPEERLDECPDCGQMSVRAKGLNEGGGVECITPGCDYWFCY